MRYSKDFNFFLENQILVSLTNNGKHTIFMSRLESKRFKTIEGLKPLSDNEIWDVCYDIHKELLN